MKEYIIENVTQKEMCILEDNNIDWFPDELFSENREVVISNEADYNFAIKLFNRKKQQFQTERMVDFMKTVELLLNDYIGDNYNPSRQTKFTITEECLTDYLKETEDDRNVKTFLDTYDSDESSVIYDYAVNDGRILSEEITYCDDFVDRYEDFIRRTQMFNPDMSAEDISSKEDYYWTVYKAQ